MRVAGMVANFAIKRDTRIIELLVSLWFRRSYERVLQKDTNVGTGTLEPRAIDASLRLSQRRAARRGGEPDRSRAIGGHAILLLLDRNAHTQFRRVCGSFLRREGARLLLHKSKFQPGSDQDARQ